MTDEQTLNEVSIWTDAVTMALTVRVLELMGPMLNPVGVGGPRTDEVDALARELDCPRHDDLRRILVDHPSTFVLLTSAATLRYDDVMAAVSEGSTVLALEPIAADFDELSGLDRPEARGRVLNVPAFNASPGWRSAADPSDALGQARMIRYSSFGQASDCSLFARLFDAFVVLQTLGELPESIDASLVTPMSEPEDLRAITGHMAAHLRLPNNRAAVLQVSDHAGLSIRELHVLGDRAELRLSDVNYDLVAPDGELIDRRDAGIGISARPDFAELIVSQWRDLLDRRLPHSGPTGHLINTHALACCLACLLSARTGEPESPAKLLSVHRQRA